MESGNELYRIEQRVWFFLLIPGCFAFVIVGMVFYIFGIGLLSVAFSCFFIWIGIFIISVALSKKVPTILYERSIQLSGSNFYPSVLILLYSEIDKIVFYTKGHSLPRCRTLVPHFHVVKGGIHYAFAPSDHEQVKQILKSRMKRSWDSKYVEE